MIAFHVTGRHVVQPCDCCVTLWSGAVLWTLASQLTTMWQPSNNQLTAMRQSCGSYVATMWQPWDNHVATMWQPWGSHVAALWQPCAKHVVTMWQPWDNHVATMWQPCDNHEKTMWQPCGNHVATMWQPWENHVATMWQPCDNHETTMWPSASTLWLSYDNLATDASQPCVITIRLPCLLQSCGNHLAKMLLGAMQVAMCHPCSYIWASQTMQIHSTAKLEQITFSLYRLFPPKVPMFFQLYVL